MALGQAQAARPVHPRRRGSRPQPGGGRDGAPADSLEGCELPGRGRRGLPAGLEAVPGHTARRLPASC
eukprot:2648295-Alexandrium_andersonii.AAC.1